jgi:hypothetical protein
LINVIVVIIGVAYYNVLHSLVNQGVSFLALNVLTRPTQKSQCSLYIDSDFVYCSNISVKTLFKLSTQLSKNKFKRQYKNQQGNMQSKLRKSNPKRFYRKFKKRKKQ